MKYDVKSYRTRYWAKLKADPVRWKAFKKKRKVRWPRDYVKLKNNPDRWSKILLRAKQKYHRDMNDPKKKEKRLARSRSQRNSRILWQKKNRYGFLFEALTPLYELKKEIKKNEKIKFRVNRV